MKTFGRMLIGVLVAGALLLPSTASASNGPGATKAVLKTVHRALQGDPAPPDLAPILAWVRRQLATVSDPPQNPDLKAILAWVRRQL